MDAVKPNRNIHIISACILLLWGSVFIYFYASERIIYYLPADGLFHPMVLWSGIGMWVLGLFNLITHRLPYDAHQHACLACPSDVSALSDAPSISEAIDGQIENVKFGNLSMDDSLIFSSKIQRSQYDQLTASSSSVKITCHKSELEQQGGVWRWICIGILTVPIAVSALFTPDQFSLHALENKGVYEVESSQINAIRQSSLIYNQYKITGSNDDKVDYDTRINGDDGSESFTIDDLRSFVTRSSLGDYQMNLAEIYISASYPEMVSVLNGLSVETLGRVIPDRVDSPEKNRLLLFRLDVMCCAADGRPYTIPLVFKDTPPSFKSMIWVKVRGVMHYQPRNGRYVPRLETTGIEETTAPENPF